MSAPIGPGDYVECVDDAPGKYGPTNVVAGVVYCVEAAFLKGDPSPYGVWRSDGVFLVGICAPREGVLTKDNIVISGYRAARFRPIYRRSDKILKSVLLPVDEEAHA